MLHTIIVWGSFYWLYNSECVCTYTVLLTILYQRLFPSPSTLNSICCYLHDPLQIENNVFQYHPIKLYISCDAQFANIYLSSAALYALITNQNINNFITDHLLQFC